MVLVVSSDAPITATERGWSSAWPSLAALPEAPDHAYIVTPTDAAIDAVAECGKLGVKVATVLADGFTEAGDLGDRRVARLRDICAATGIRVVGPSSLGIVDLRTRAMPQSARKASATSSSPASAPVCETASSRAACERPSL